MFGLLRSKPLLDEESAQWIFDVYHWALTNLGSDVFQEETRLVLPSSEDFPGRADSLHGMARLIFDQVVAHAGMGHWPLELVEPGQPTFGDAASLRMQGPLRGRSANAAQAVEPAARLSLAYTPALVNEPEALIAEFAHQLAHLLATQVDEAPPGGHENWPYLTELLGGFMGFGLMFANTAFKAPRGGCGSCAVGVAQRASFLSQYDLTYALALFSILKDIRPREVLPHLRKPLRPFFKGAVKEIERRAEALEALQTVGQPG